MGDKAKLTTKAFDGTNVFVSRNLVPPEIFDNLHDVLKRNGAQVFPYSDPSRIGPNDYHIISSLEHEKFEDLRANGCNLVGPRCVLSCVKENRGFPKQGFTCCLAMDGVKVLASGFEKEEKVKIEKLVTAMGGVLQTKASVDVNFVIARSVLAGKYKWASNVLKKPIVTTSWLNQCWNEHRVVQQEPYILPPFSGLTICATRIPEDVRKELEKLVIQNSGKYSAGLTKKCTHLVADALYIYVEDSLKNNQIPEGSKFEFARKWGHIHIVTRQWVYQCIAKRVCLGEESYPVQRISNSSTNTVKSGRKRQHDGNYQSVQASEMRKLVHMVHKGGGSRYMPFNENLTHIVVGTTSERTHRYTPTSATVGFDGLCLTIPPCLALLDTLTNEIDKELYKKAVNRITNDPNWRVTFLNIVADKRLWMLEMLD